MFPHKPNLDPGGFSLKPLPPKGKIWTAQLPGEEERSIKKKKYLTIFFVSMATFTSLSRGLGPSKTLYSVGSLGVRWNASKKTHQSRFLPDNDFALSSTFQMLVLLRAGTLNACRRYNAFRDCSRIIRFSVIRTGFLRRDRVNLAGYMRCSQPHLWFDFCFASSTNKKIFGKRCDISYPKIHNANS